MLGEGMKHAWMLIELGHELSFCKEKKKVQRFFGSNRSLFLCRFLAQRLTEVSRVLGMLDEQTFIIFNT